MSLPLEPMRAALCARLIDAVPAVERRVFDQVPQKSVFPYLQVVEIEVYQDDAGCIEGHDIRIIVHVWARTVGKVSVGRIASDVQRVLHHSDALIVPGFELIDIEHDTTTIRKDTDGITSQAVCLYRAMTVAA